MKGSPKTKIVCAARKDGIGTRLLTIIYARIFAEAIRFDFKVIWPQLGSPLYDNNGLFHSYPKHKIFLKDYVFEGETRRGDFSSRDSIEARRILNLRNERQRLDGMDFEQFQAFVDDFDVVLYNQPYPLVQFLRYEVDIPSEVKRLWKCIVWNFEITQFVDDVSSRLSIQDCIAVHIRRGDLVNALVQADIISRAPGCRVFFRAISR